MILLDTNVVSEPLNKRPSRQVIAWLRSQAPETLFLSAISVGELRTGIALLPEGKRRNALHDELELGILPNFVGRILPFDLECTPFPAAIMAQARRTGRAIAFADSYIAAIAARHRLAVATRDAAPFPAAGAAVINPWLE